MILRARMRANGNFSDISLERLHSVSIKFVMSPSDAIDLEWPLFDHVDHVVLHCPIHSTSLWSSRTDGSRWRDTRLNAQVPRDPVPPSNAQALGQTMRKKYGFTKLIGCDDLDSDQSNDSLKPSKLKRRNELKHKENTDSVETFKARRARYGMKGTLPPNVRYLFNFSATPARFLWSFYNRKSTFPIITKEPHTVDEELIKPTAVWMVQILVCRNKAKTIS